MSVASGGRRMLCMLAIGLGWALIAAGEAQGQPPVRYHLRIPSQPLDSALQEFARQSGLQVIYFSGITAGLRAPALDGYYTLETAMRALLADSGLTCRVINSKTVEIRPPAGTRSPRDRADQHTTNIPDGVGIGAPRRCCLETSAPGALAGARRRAGQGPGPAPPAGNGWAWVTPFGGCTQPRILNDVELMSRGIRSCAR
jgi:hypothetical protein